MWCVKLFFVGITAVMAAPRSTTHTSNMLQVPVSETSDAVNTAKALTSLRDISSPLSFAADARLARVREMRKVESQPLVERVESLNATIATLEQRVSEVSARLSELPALIRQHEATRDGATNRINQLKTERQQVESVSRSELNALQAKITHAAVDKGVLNDILVWVESNAPKGDIKGSQELLSEASKRLSHMGSEVTALLQASSLLQTQPVDDLTKPDLSSVHAVKSHVSALLQSVESTHASLLSAFQNATAHLAAETARMESEHKDQERILADATAMATALTHEQTIVSDTLATKSAALAESKQSRDTIIAEIAEIDRTWTEEERQLEAILASIQTVMALLPSGAPSP